jgi:hypothetical protein
MCVTRLISQHMIARTMSNALLIPPISEGSASEQCLCNGHCDPASDDNSSDKADFAGDIDGGGREVDGVDVGERAGVSDRERFHLGGS